MRQAEKDEHTRIALESSKTELPKAIAVLLGLMAVGALALYGVARMIFG